MGFFGNGKDEDGDDPRSNDVGEIMADRIVKDVERGEGKEEDEYNDDGEQSEEADDILDLDPLKGV